ncbi:S-adenosylmethionine:tRNA ribosyltransferase-isomerase [Croceimicrobium hydrocarbonivorans]|uniref:S-adenosylmethionine:tRNA ribosyltransferase-isomerase n=1 Tax=Croceimicrobium hydrocarbonivorans TaxID=2761580 RepID=A0A7H0VEV1_9FLAO|nr:S-adenosylmethionine:tRNA ribosyltransferase-isomerase [Croceimicrobium hydrocarbonivorans]QNR24249.1 S-adenosylmethionine:tRNA ribosyltransferase-isomerase [Croceimicrobium hydrocarbonivorans]
MEHRQIDIETYNYPLPEDRIAEYPLARGESKLLIFKDQEIRESQYKSIDQYLPENAWMVFNETRVVQARLLFPKNEQSIIEIFCLEPLEHKSIEQAMQAKGSIRYSCLVGGARKWKNHDLEMDLGALKLKARKMGREEAQFDIELSWDQDLSFSEVLELAGKTPLPPYIKRKAEAQDKVTYQTTYARRSGSVAAPTAGLHFNEAIFQKLQDKGIELNYLTLHVGAGTFKPVSTSVAEHEMHAEESFLDRSFIQKLKRALAAGKAIIPVGTTSLRALESLYWLGCLHYHKQLNDGELIVPQWLGFENPEWALEPLQALESLEALLDENSTDWLPFKTQIIIAPGYQHRLITALVTNFHQPKSTLMLLVSSLIEEHWLEVYQYALDHEFRFLSYGDGCLLYRS